MRAGEVAGRSERGPASRSGWKTWGTTEVGVKLVHSLCRKPAAARRAALPSGARIVVPWRGASSYRVQAPKAAGELL
jgi:hypothetical protein